MSENILNLNADAVVMLTASHWFTELRSNRYHYASRFAKHYSVIFVQPNANISNYRYINTEHDNITLLEVPLIPPHLNTGLLTKALREKNISNPILWIYDCRYIHFAKQHSSPLVVYHATEDYFSEDSPAKFEKNSTHYKALIECIDYADLIMCVSEGVAENIRLRQCKPQSIFVNTNGCDFEFYSEKALDQMGKNHKKIVFYQGNIYSKLNYDLLYSLAQAMPHWEFHFCGRVNAPDNRWDNLLTLSNVRYLGELSVENLREHAYQSTIGIIPFEINDYLTKRSFPLKAFEYLACGLPVVSSPIDSLTQFKDLFTFAKDVESFKKAIEEQYHLRFDKEALKHRLEQASLQSYNIKFENLIKRVNNDPLSLARNNKRKDKMRVLVLYESKSTKVKTLYESLHCIKRYSNHDIFYCPATPDLAENISVTLGYYDAVVIHYSLRLSVTSGNYTLSPSMASALEVYRGLKILFIQDEYDTTNTAKAWIKRLNFNVVYTCVPEESIESVYPAKEFPITEFIPILTGYIPEELVSMKPTPLEERKSFISYRGRNLPFWYGDLGQEKMNIGVRMHELALARGLPVDIEWTEEKRIYGDAWYEFLGSARATLGTESGANVFDFEGKIRANIESYLAENPHASYEEVRELFLQEHEGKICMNQISPKLFEAITLRTALILFEGTYSGVLEPHKHYIPLKKDFSNVDEVFKQLEDLDSIKALTERAYSDIIGNKKYHYRSFIEEFDQLISAKATPNEVYQLIPADVCVYKNDYLKGTIEYHSTERGVFSELLAHNIYTQRQKAPSQSLAQPSLHAIPNVTIPRPSYFSRMKKKLMESPKLYSYYVRIYHKAPFMRPLLSFSKKAFFKLVNNT